MADAKQAYLQQDFLPKRAEWIEMMPMLGGLRRTSLGKPLAYAADYVRGEIISRRYSFASHSRNTPKGGIVKIRLNSFPYSRNFYLLVKMLTLSDYCVYLDVPKVDIFRLQKTDYCNLLFEERLVRLWTGGRAETGLRDARGASKSLEPWDFRRSNDERTYVMPMLQHPIMYSSPLLWAQNFGELFRRNSVLFVGNNTLSSYYKAHTEELFSVVQRYPLLSHLKKQNLFWQFSLTHGSNDAPVTIIEGRVAPSLFRQTIARYRYFLAAPGADWPLCHNLPESMSVGTVPVIQAAYADLLDPPLEHGVNAIIFHGLDDVAGKIDDALSQSPSVAAKMQTNCLNYYINHMMPSAVASRLLSRDVKTVKLLCAHASMELLRVRRRELTGSGC